MCNHCIEWTVNWQSGKQKHTHWNPSVLELSLVSCKCDLRKVIPDSYTSCASSTVLSFTVEVVWFAKMNVLEIWFQPQQQKAGWSFRQSKIAANRIPHVTGDISLPSVSRTRERTGFIHRVETCYCSWGVSKKTTALYWHIHFAIFSCLNFLIIFGSG